MINFNFNSEKDLLEVEATLVTSIMDSLHALREAFTYVAPRIKQGRRVKISSWKSVWDIKITFCLDKLHKMWTTIPVKRGKP